MSSRLNLLASYAYISKQGDDYLQDVASVGKKANILIDSGGFTDYWNSIKVAALGKPIARIKVENYIEFCQGIKNYVFGYIQLDKPRDPEASYNLLMKQVDAGLKPIPIFIQGMEWERLPELLSINERVCISAGWQSSTEYSYQRYQKAFKLTNGKIKSHALGFGRYPQILGLPIASADSSTWVNGGKYGVVKIFNRPYKLISMDRRKLERSPNYKLIMSRLQSFKVSIEDMNDKQQWHVMADYPSLTQATHTFAYLQVMKYIKQTKGIDYFIVIPGLAKSTYFCQLLAVLSSINEKGLMDYQLYKVELRKVLRLEDDAFRQYMLSAIDGYERVA